MIRISDERRATLAKELLEQDGQLMDSILAPALDKTQALRQIGLGVSMLMQVAAESLTGSAEPEDPRQLKLFPDAD